ncbi:MAG: TrkH family potassium uptake protein [Vicinamibacteria bacterium]|nr:TrkH family potassium uptake protein [Vicinamibacteria bacterium]
MRSADNLSPAALLVGSFAAAILVGTVLLMLPMASTGKPLDALEALFMSTSAVCVTGLAVVDPGTRLTGFGQGVLLALLQGGGLGIMTFAIFVTAVVGRGLSLRDRAVLVDSMHHSPSHELRRLLRHVLRFTLIVEGVGALALWLRWRHQLEDAAYQSVFHAVSAFCNAGFSLFPDSLVRFRGDAWVNLVIGGLIVIGGLGFLVTFELRDWVFARLRRQRPPALSLQARLVFATTLGLLLLGFAGFLLLEWSNTLRGLPLPEKLLAAGFQSVTPRTAGFNTIDYGQAAAATLFFTILLMFVGGAPGSTAGGIKTTSLALLLALVRSRSRGHRRAFAFERTIPDVVMDRALTLTLLSGTLVTLAILVLAGLELGSSPAAESRPQFIALCFEVVSAFATVGLSTGITATLSAPGQLLLVVLMLVGRVGPLTLALAVAGRRPRGHFRYAEENVMVG